MTRRSDGSREGNRLIRLWISEEEEEGEEEDIVNVDWSQALRIMSSGILAVFVIMAILALVTHLLGKTMTRLERPNSGR